MSEDALVCEACGWIHLEPGRYCNGCGTAATPTVPARAWRDELVIHAALLVMLAGMTGLARMAAG